jgi:translation initiation factor 1A
MGKNTGKGGKTRRRGKKSMDENDHKKELVLREDDTNYGYISKVCGNGRFEIICNDEKTRMGILRGSLRKKVWIISGDLILYGIREFQDDRIDILHKYSIEEISSLYQYEEITKKLYNLCTSESYINDSENINNHVLFGEKDTIKPRHKKDTTASELDENDDEYEDEEFSEFL